MAEIQFDRPGQTAHSVPTALTAALCQRPATIEVTVGFENGHFNIYNLDPKTSRLELRSSHGSSTEGSITAMASSSPYLLTVSEHNFLSLYEMPALVQGADKYDSMTAEPRLLTSLKADSIVAPTSLAIRVSGSEIIPSIVYSFFHIGCGWSLGIQELRLNRNGEQIGSRLATTVDSQYGMKHVQNAYRPSGFPENQNDLGEQRPTVPSEPFILHQQPPTSMSYSHPYLLTSHSDNTLTMYIVVSTSENLFVKGGERLWGHTSSVSAVQVSDRGKAVSVSSFGDEIRLWELEAAISSSGTRKAPQGGDSIQITPENKRYRDPSDLDILSRAVSHTAQLAYSDTSSELSATLGCVGFDDERVLLFREKDLGAPWLECYDFT